MCFNFAAGNTVSLFGPGAEIDQLTTIRAKRQVWIIVPRAFFPASGAFHMQRHGFLLSYLRGTGKQLVDPKLFGQKTLVFGIIDETLEISPILFYAIGPWIIAKGFSLFFEQMPARNEA